MSTTDTITTQMTQLTSDNADVPEQLSLLAGSVPLQFRLDERTRRSGLQHITQLRQQMAAQAAARRTPSTQFVKRDHRDGRQIAA